MTWASGPSLNPPVLAVFLVDEIERATPTASDEPSVSTQSRSGMWRSSPSLIGSDHITPEESITRSEERSQRPGWASSSSSSGLAKASPTMEISVTRCRAMRVEDAGGVEPHVLGEHDRAAGVEGAEGRERRGAVHERGGRKHPGAARRVERRQQGGDVGEVALLGVADRARCG